MILASCFRVLAGRKGSDVVIWDGSFSKTKTKLKGISRYQALAYLRGNNKTVDLAERTLQKEIITP